jgi:vesicle coat complex subunit
MTMIMTVMKEAFNHTNADVRKSVVFCLVEVNFLLGDDFSPFMAELAPN